MSDHLIDELNEVPDDDSTPPVTDTVKEAIEDPRMPDQPAAEADPDAEEGG